jgi:hypothetical protein
MKRAGRQGGFDVSQGAEGFLVRDGQSTGMWPSADGGFGPDPVVGPPIALSQERPFRTARQRPHRANACGLARATHVSKPDIDAGDVPTAVSRHWGLLEAWGRETRTAANAAGAGPRRKLKFGRSQSQAGRSCIGRLAAPTPAALTWPDWPPPSVRRPAWPGRPSPSGPPTVPARGSRRSCRSPSARRPPGCPTQDYRRGSRSEGG